MKIYAVDFVANVLAIDSISPNIDQHQISPFNNNASYNKVVTSIKHTIVQEELFAWYFNKFS